MDEDGDVKEDVEEEQEQPVKRQKHADADADADADSTAPKSIVSLSTYHKRATAMSEDETDDIDGLSSEPDELPRLSDSSNPLETFGKRPSAAISNVSSPSIVPAKRSKRIERSMIDEDIITPAFPHENARRTHLSPLSSRSDQEERHDPAKSNNMDRRLDIDSTHNNRSSVKDKITPLVSDRSQRGDEIDKAELYRKSSCDDSRKDGQHEKAPKEPRANGQMELDTNHAPKHSASHSLKNQLYGHARKRLSGRSATYDLPVRKVSHPAHVQNEWYCNICQKDCCSEANYNSHIAGKDHKRCEKARLHRGPNLELELKYAQDTIVSSPSNDGVSNDSNAPVFDMQQLIATSPAAASIHEVTEVPQPAPALVNSSNDAVRKPQPQSRFKDASVNEQNEINTASLESETERVRVGLEPDASESMLVASSVARRPEGEIKRVYSNRPNGAEAIVSLDQRMSRVHIAGNQAEGNASLQTSSEHVDLSNNQKAQRRVIPENESQGLDTSDCPADLSRRVELDEQMAMDPASSRSQPENADTIMLEHENLPTPLLILPPPTLLPKLNCPEMSLKMTVNRWRALREVAFNGDQFDHLTFKIIQEFLISPILGVGSQHLRPFNEVMKMVSHYVSQDGRTKNRFSEYHRRLTGDTENDTTFSKYGVLPDDMSKAVEAFGDNLQYQFWRASPSDSFINKDHLLAAKVPPRGRYGNDLMPKYDDIKIRVDDVQSDALFQEITYGEQSLTNAS